MVSADRGESKERERSEKEGERGERTRNTDMLCLAVLRDCLLEKMYCISPVLPTLVVQGY